MWGESCWVTIRISDAGARLRISRHASSPLIFGIVMSSTTTSGFKRSALSTASRPSAASSMISHSGCPPSKVLNPCRTTGWSSTTKIRTVINVGSGKGKNKLYRLTRCYLLLYLIFFTQLPGTGDTIGRDRYSDPDRRARAIRLKLKLSSEFASPFVHTHQPNARSPSGIAKALEHFLFNAAPVVFHFQN